MRRSIYYVLIIFFFYSLTIAPATYKGRIIDGEKFAAQLWKASEKTRYRVSVVFVGKDAKIVFAPNQVLPPRFANNMYLTLHLKNEEIGNPDQVPLLELIPPDNPEEADKDKKKWEIAGYWFMKVEIK